MSLRVVFALLALCLSVQAPAQTTRPKAKADAPITVALLALEGVYNSELTAPMDIFHHTIFHVEPGMTVFTVGREKGMITSFEGLQIGVQYKLEDAPPFDVLVVPAAVHNMDSDLDDERLIDWVRERGKACKYVMSVCDGAFVLAQAGLLDGRYCTTFPGDIAPLRARFSALEVVEGVTFVADGPAITGAGGARSFEPALYLVEHLYGEKVARGVGRGMVLDWDLERERHMILPDGGAIASRPRCFLPGQQIGPSVMVEGGSGRIVSLEQIVANQGDVKAVVLVILAGAEAIDAASRGGYWCEDTFNEIPNLRHLKLKHADDGVLFVAVACPPIFHEERFGYDEGAFLGRAADDPVFLDNRKRFVEATLGLIEADAMPFDIVAFDSRFRLLGAPELERAEGDRVAPWQGRFKWYTDTQMYGTPTIWVLTRDLEVVGPPFSMNVYETDPPKLRYTPADVSRMINKCLAR